MSYGKPPAPAKYASTMVSSLPREIAYTNIKKEKKMGWFKRKFAQWSREAWENSRGENIVARESDTPLPKTSVRFAIYPASGGWVIEHNKLDRFKDGEGPTLTIITDFDDLGKTVEHIITLEALRS
jgi:hypothetical protein